LGVRALILRIRAPFRREEPTESIDSAENRRVEAQWFTIE